MINKKYWTENNFKLLSEANTLTDLSKIAIEVLQGMKSAGREIAVVCGPLTTGGYASASKNLLIFTCAISMADLFGEFVFDQSVFFGPISQVLNKNEHAKAKSGYQTEILIDFFEPIFRSRHIGKALFLKGWETSVGANWEHSLCRELGIQVLPYPEAWLPRNLFNI